MREPGGWFWAAIAAGLMIRIALVVFSTGSLDVTVWTRIAQEVTERGLIATYHAGDFTNNHPPFIALLVTRLWQLAQATGFPFAILHRAPYVLLDAGTVWVLITLLACAGSETLRRARFALAVVYWLCPISIIFSSFHGNTDSSIAFFLTAAALAVARGRPLLAGAMLGASLWFKLPGVLAAPVLILALPTWRQRLLLCVAAGVVGISTYLPALVADPLALIQSVLLYPGLRIQTTSGLAIWGLPIFYPPIAELPESLRPMFRTFVRVSYHGNTWICIVPIVVVAWLRRGRRGSEAIARGVTESYVIFYGLTSMWSFQYLAWSLPFWLLSGVAFSLPALVLSSAYVWGAYAWLCDSALLLGRWDFIGKPDWPLALRLVRDAASLFFLIASLHVIVSTLRDSLAGRSSTRRSD